MLDLSTLNKPQYEAVVSTDGPLLILAGAGSGKTKVLTYKIAYLLDTGLAGSTNVLAMTFTNKAANEMRERIEHVLYDNQKQGNLSQVMNVEKLPWIGTFHSICVKLLKRFGQDINIARNFTIFDPTDQKESIKEAMKRLGISIKEFNPSSILSYISSAKNEFIGFEEYSKLAQGYFQSVVAKVYPIYQEILRENNALDFDDLLTKVVELLSGNPILLENLQDQFKYILIDEYQDTNHVQYLIVKLLSAKYKNICVVGDDDQSIYAFRGATIKNILNFERDFPESKVIKLEQNYRSTKVILEASHQVISKNSSRKEKKLWTENSDGSKIILYSANDEVDESNWVVREVEAFSVQIKYSDMAVLYRTNAQSRTIEEAFLRSAIPYRIVGTVGFYERREVKDILAYLKSIFNQKDSKNLERIINVPRRGIGPKSIIDIKNKALEKNESLFEYILNNNHEEKGLNTFRKTMIAVLAELPKLSVSGLIKKILEETKYITFLEDGKLENESRIENLGELISVASKFDEFVGFESLEMFLDEVSLLENMPKKDENGDVVTLMTIHASKGLEFKIVFLVGAEENLFPHSSSSLDQKDLEEERRLAYVAITRAKEILMISHARQRKYFGIKQVNSLSRFIKDIDTSLVEYRYSENNTGFNDSDAWDNIKSEDYEPIVFDFSIGDSVKHEYFGKGKIVSLNLDTVTVDFGVIHGRKELVIEYSKLEKI